MASKKRIEIDSPINSIDTPWDDGVQAYKGAWVEKFIKDQLSSKIGHLAIPQDKDTDGYYHVWGFADRQAYSDYMTDPVTESAKRLSNVAIPILEEQGGVSNIVTLTRQSAANIVTSTPVASVQVSYLWQQYNPVTKETTDQDEDAVITVSCRTQSANGAWGAWDTTKEFVMNIQSGQTKYIDLSRILTSDATYQVRLVATGETSGISTSPVTLSILYSNVKVTYEGAIATAYTGNTVQLPFRIFGSVQKQLRLKINGQTKSISLGTTTYTDNIYGAQISKNEFGLERGAIKAEAWIAFGEGYTAETERQEFQFIYIPENDANVTPVLAVSNIMEAFQNWTRATIFRYAIYNPESTETPLRITLQDRDSGQVYIQRETVCVNGESYDFNENFSMEREGGEQPSTINAQVSFTDLSGKTYGNNINFVVDNSENFAPTRGANVILSAEKHSITIEGTAYELDHLLKHTGDTNTGWLSTNETDLSGQTVSVPVLSIGAGNRLILPYELFDANTGKNIGGQEGSVTMEFDIKTKNIVGGAAVIDASASFNKAYTGLRFYPTRAVCLSQNNFSEDICDVHFQEEVREHIAVNIIRNLRGEGMNLVRIYVNGKSNRSFIYTDDDSFIPIGGRGAQTITIGSDEADIDIYSIRIYKGQQLGSTQIQNDYMAGMPTIEDKKLFKRYNSIFNGTEIGYDLCNAMGLNTILRKIPEGGHYPSRENQSKQKGVDVVVRIYKERGDADSLDTRHSGTFTGMTDKGQGTSAKGYYWWNISDGFEDDVVIDATEYDASNPAHYEDGGKFYKKISYFNSLDGTSQFYASKYELEDGRGGITKIVGKANYASPMQSHKLGAIWAYDELWQRLVNNGSSDRPVLEGHATCYEKPFLAFYQIGNGNPVFCGFQTWGSGKGDKKTFGYDKTKSPGYMCVSGADNGAIAALFQMPWVVNQNPQGAWEGNIYAKSVTINTGDIKNGYCYKAGNSDTLSFEVEIGSKYDGGETDNGVTRIEDEAKGGTETTLFTHFGDFCNFIFASSPLLKPYAGTEAQLIADSANLSRDYQYWLFNSGSDRYSVYYYNPATSTFEKIVKVPTAWGADGRASAYGSPKLTEQLAGVTISVKTINGKANMTLEKALETLGTSDMNVVNDCFVKARVAYFKAHADSYIDRQDIIFHQTFCKLEAATDNRTKNTYYWIDPAVDKLVRLKQDDLDTIKATDNQGRQTKPYYALEHTKDANGNNYWNGENNVFYTLIEMSYADELRNMMRQIFAEMSLIAGSVADYYQKRYYWVQEYFPAVAYNEASRVLYEVAQVKMMNGQIDVSQDPITQAVGDQLECEKQFMNQRLPMLMSWCEYETEGNDGSLSFRSVNSLDGGLPVYEIAYTAYQYIYPKVSLGGAMPSFYARKDGEWVLQDSDQPYLCAPGETVKMVVSAAVSNQQLTLRWLHYAQDIGNIGALSCGDEGSITLTGKRLRKLECWSEDGTPIEFHPRGLTISNCRNLEEINLTNASGFSGTFSGDFPRLKKLNLRGSGYTNVNLPKTSTLTEVGYPSSINSITVDGQPNLESVLVQDLGELRTLAIRGKHKIQSQTQSIIQLAYLQSKELNKVEIENIHWSGLAVDALMWLQRIGASLTGEVTLSGNLGFNDKVALADTYGNIDRTDNPLHVNYTKRTINSIIISGLSYIIETGTYKYDLTCLPSTGNDIALDGNHIAAEWSIDGAGAYAAFTDTVNGILKVTRLDDSDTDTRYTAHCVITNTSGFNLRADYRIGFYQRVPKIGDFAYADGTFDDQYFGSKTLAGVVYKVNEMWQGNNEVVPTVFTGYDKPSDTFKSTRQLVGYQVLIDCKEDIHYLSSDGFINANSSVFGLGSSEDGDDNVAIEEEMMAATGMSSIFDIPALNNIKTRGLDDTFNGYVTTANYLDKTADNGFKDASGTYGTVTDWQGAQNTQAIIRHANQIINGYLLSEANESVSTGCTTEDGKDYLLTKLPTSLTELADDMETLLKSNNNLTKYQQFLYPAAYGCHLYAPRVKDGETLDSQYAASNWYLPGCGELYRIYSFFAQSRTGGMGETYSVGVGTLPDRSVIDNMIRTALSATESNEIKRHVSPAHVENNEYTTSEIDAINRYFHSLAEAQKPIYSMVLWRAMVEDGSAPFTSRTTSTYWSSTEMDEYRSWFIIFYNGYNYPNYGKGTVYRVRPSVAYRFYLKTI